MQDHRVGFHLPEHRGIDGVPLQFLPVPHALGPDARLVDDVHFANHAIDVGLQLVLHAVFVEIVEDVGLHLQFGRADEEDLHALELRQQVGQRPRRAALVEFADDGDAQSVERTFAIDRVQIEQRLRGMLAAIAISGIDDRYGRDLRRPPRPAFFVMADHDHVAVAADDANRVFHLLGFDFGGKRARMLGGEHPAAQPVHGRLEAETGAGRGLVEQRGQDPVLIVERAAASDHALHPARAVEQFHQQRHGELLRLDQMPQLHRVRLRRVCLIRLSGFAGTERRMSTSLSSSHRNFETRRATCLRTTSASGTTCVPARPATASHRCS